MDAVRAGGGREVVRDEEAMCDGGTAQTDDGLVRIHDRTSRPRG
jgi:hypothetical protein